MEQQKRWVYFLPNIFTCLNMGCGFMCILLAHKGLYFNGSLFLVLGAIFDSVDGRVARLTGTESEFGEQFDSMSDVISFGAAPAILFYEAFLIDSGRAGVIVAFFFLLCGALRLARFNANIGKISSSYFQGLPIPMAALSIVGFTLLSLKWSFMGESIPLAMSYIVCFSLMMVSNIPFPSFKNANWVKEHKRSVLFVIFASGALTIVYEHFMLMILLVVYMGISSIIWFKHRGRLKELMNDAS
ncbi:CDP-diacylglycerol--serine O-phosphatidyltransferase [Bacteriovoracaceae bacterium]|nr:CDP-diacylglycerol--serine O-phosphatidyltransferase [Bacteriovoracaceae bacterium]